MRLAVYCDYSYRTDGNRLYAELPLAIFLDELARHCDRLVAIGRLDPGPGRFPFELHNVDYVPLPYYRSGADLAAVARAMPTGIRAFWRALANVDVVWILGPNPPQALAFALIGLLRRRRIALGVRQHLPTLIRHRHPGKPHVWLAALALEAAFRLLGRLLPVVVVGGDIARSYRHSAALQVIYVSMLRNGELTSQHRQRHYDAERLRILSVGRLDPEKNPLLLADILAELRREDPRWHLDICGEGTLRDELAARLQDLGLSQHATLHGYVPIDDGLWDLYRDCHLLLHVSHTEGVPQVLLEAFAARLPVVATDVGGVSELVEGRGLLVAPDDAVAAARALRRLAWDERLRLQLTERGLAQARDHTLETECARLADFLSMNS